MSWKSHSQPWLARHVTEDCINTSTNQVSVSGLLTVCCHWKAMQPSKTWWTCTHLGAKWQPKHVHWLLDINCAAWSHRQSTGLFKSNNLIKTWGFDLWFSPREQKYLGAEVPRKIDTKTHPAIHLKLQLTKTALSAWNQKKNYSTLLPCSAFTPASQKGTVLSAGCSLMSQSRCPLRS